MNILFVADVSIADVIGGAERVLYEQSTRLVLRGYDVSIMTRHLPVYQNQNEQIKGIKEWRYEINQSNAISYLKSIWKNSKILFESLQHQHQFDVIIFEQPFSALGVVKSSLSRNVKKLYVCHSLSFEEYISRNKKPDQFLKQIAYKLNVAFRKFIEKKALNSSEKIIVLSQFTIDKLNKAYKIPAEKFSIVPGGVDLNRFRPALSNVEIRKTLQLAEDSVILFTVRNLVPRMGLENLIQAIAQVVKEAPDVFLVIGGTGPLKEQLAALAKNLNLQDHIRFDGFIPEERLPDYYRMADLFILPTRELEGFGLVTLEAMASGTPVLGTPVGGTQEILGQFDPGFLFKDTSPESMAQLILEKYQEMNNDPEKWQEIRKKCRRFVEENYSWDRHVDALEAFINNNSVSP